MSKKVMIIISIMIILLLIIVSIITTSKNNVTYAVGDALVDVVIKENKGSSWSSGASGVYNTIYTKEDGTTIGSDYRYIGASVNNYVSFNNDLYQIIGVFDANTHGIEGKQLVKIIRSKALGAYSWGVVNTELKDGVYSNCYNDWTGVQYTTPPNANILLNKYFYNKTSVNDIYGECSNWTYFNNSNLYKSSDCSTIVGAGIKTNLRNYIETTSWYLNGYSSNELTVNNFYLCERGLYTGCGSANSGNGDVVTNEKIGLMYVSDYMYASGYQASNSTSSGTSKSLGRQNWLYKGIEFTIVPNSNTANSVFNISNLGSILSTTSCEGKIIRPTFYLKEDVYVTGGEGTFDNPYLLDCDNCSEN